MFENIEKHIDFRPYMNDNPMTVNLGDSIHKCTDVFRKMHLRHLCVIHPIGGKLEGIITRQDLFLWLDL
jgi:predicted transcriptional regulator